MGLVYIWRPVTGGRHAYSATARNVSHEEIVTAYCGVETPAAEIHAATEMDWIRGDTCMACWRALASRPSKHPQ